LITRRSWRALVRVAALAMAFALCFGTVPMAYAELESAASYTSETNPSVGENATWRWYWGNSWNPQLTVSSIPADSGELADTRGFVYQINQMAPGEDREPDPFPLAQIPDFGSASVSVKPGNATVNGTFDIPGVVTRQGWTAYPGHTVKGEGLYRLTLRYYNQFRIEDAADTDSLLLGIDMTRPSPAAELTSTAWQVGATPYTESRWRRISWDDRVYDTLSGLGAVKIAVGKVTDENPAVIAKNNAPDPVYEQFATSINPFISTLPQLTYFDIEDLPAGATTITVTMVDRATNESTPMYLKSYVDTDTPTLKVTKPTAGAKVGVKPTMSVVASDKAGISSVKYYVDDKLVYTATKAPYSGYPDLSSYASGGHTLKVVAADMIGTATGPWTKAHTTTATVSFTLDKSAPSMSITSKGPNPFYPRKREGYKDNYVVKFNTNEAGTAYLDIYSGGKLYRSVKKSMVSGANSISWDGKSSSGALKATGYSVKLRLVDSAGNTRTSSSFGATIRFYEVVRTSSGSARVIER